MASSANVSRALGPMSFFVHAGSVPYFVFADPTNIGVGLNAC